MFRLAPRHLPRTLPTGTLRLLTTTPARPNKGPPTTQGHTSTKDKDDPQASSAHAAHAEKHHSSSSADANGNGEGEPFDAARQGGTGGEAKSSKTQATSGVDKGQSGAFKDQVGGQEGGGSDKGVEFGGQEPAAENTATQGLKNTNPGQGQGFEGLRKLREEGKNFHTSARAHRPATAAEPTPGAPGGSAQQTRKMHMSTARSAHSPPSDKYAKTHHDSESHAAT
ncbi:hypothetical protein B9479_008223, partial [Cryptococcus floricola]